MGDNRISKARTTVALITYIGWHGDVAVISRHYSIKAAERAFTWTLNNAHEHLGIRRGQLITLAVDGRADVVGTVL
jgi:uncharacterized protein YijF (DUF1287 family)